MNFSSAPLPSSELFRSDPEANSQAMACATNTNQVIAKDMFQTEFDCTSSTLIEPEMESGFCGTKSNELRDFILYRYYLSQYPELFSSQHPPILQSKHDDEDNMGTVQPPYQRSTTAEGQLPLFYLSSAEDDTLTSKFLELSLGRPKTKLCKRSHTDTENDTRCCFMCRCSNRNQSDSSLWSLSEPDLSQMAKNDHYDSKSHILPNQSNNLEVGGRQDERYSHLCRVITPPNAFLNNSTAPPNGPSDLATGGAKDDSAEFDDCLCAHIPKTISYSNKVTQTDSELDQPKQYKVFSTKLQRFYSLSEPQKHLYSQSSKSVQGAGGRSVESDHIYQAIIESNSAELQSVQKPSKSGAKQKSKKEKDKSSSLLSRARSLKLEEIKQRQIELIKNSSFRQSPTNNKIHDCRTSSLPPVLMASGGPTTSNQCAMLGLPGKLSFAGLASGQQIEEEHRIATSKDGIPCTCHRCRESRGLNLTTELLPLDTQIPLQSMENMDSLFQDSMTELVCTII